MNLNDLISREIQQKLEIFSELLLKWNQTINLISSKTIEDLKIRHILDSVQLLKYIGNKNLSVLDIGPGAGFPGLILSICGVEKVILVESDSRKCAFLLQAALLSSKEVVVINDRVENLINLTCDILVCRGFGSLESIFCCTKNIKIKDKYLLLKGQSYNSEIIVAQKKWLFDVKVHDSMTSNQGKILEITK